MSSQKSNSSVVLSDQTQWTVWFKSIKSRAKSLKVWTKIEPGSQLRLLEEPTEPEVPSILGHESYAGVDEPTEVQQLTANGPKAYEREMVRYRILLDAYKVKQHKYEKEVTDIDTITQLVQSTVATHFQDSCCDPDDSNGLPISDAVSVSTTERKRKMPANVIRRLFSRCEAQANGIRGSRNMTKPPAMQMQNPWDSLISLYSTWFH
ncbi:hypothetical protein E4U27_001535 [Claviceps purpurea]|nr:hypothetical protein E4U27_001535 [Claviceps purpurea]